MAYVGSHSNSLVWISQESRDKNKFDRKAATRRRFFKDNYRKLGWVLPHSHEQEEHLQTAIQTAREETLLARQAVHIPAKPFGGRLFMIDARPDLSTSSIAPIPGFDISISNFGAMNAFARSTVLAMPTIWLHHELEVVNKRRITSATGFLDPDIPNFEPVWPNDCIVESNEASWPTPQEFKYEGEDRIFTDVRYGRFLPVPRKPGNTTVNWQQLPYLDQHDFDQVCCGSNKKKPDYCDILFMEFEVGFEALTEEDVGDRFVGSDLMGRLDPDE